MESIRLFESISEEVTIKAPYVFSLSTEIYVPSKDSVTSATISVDGTVTEKEPYLIKYTSTDGNIVTLYSVTAFTSSDGSQANILSNTYENGQGVIEFDKEVSVIGNSAFMLCSSLTSVEIPSSVTTIDFAAFQSCSSLSSVTFAEGSQLTTIVSSVFRSCTSLTTINIPSGVTRIVGTFIGCSSLTSVTFAEGSQLTSIGDDAFVSCNRLTSIDIPSGVTNIGSSAFYGCSSLTNFTLPKSLTKMCTGEGYRAYPVFNNCPNLTSITYNDIEYISKKALAEALNANGVTSTDTTTPVNFSIESFKGTGLFDVTPTIVYYADGTYEAAEIKGELYGSLLRSTFPNSTNGVKLVVGASVTKLVSKGGYGDYISFPQIMLADDCVLQELKASYGLFGSKCISFNTNEEYTAVIPNTVTEIYGGKGSSEYGTFKGAGFKNIKFEEGSSLVKLSACTFAYSQLEEFTIPDSIQELQYLALAYASNLCKVNYKGVTYTSKSTLTTALTDNGVTVGDSAFAGTSLSA